MKSIKVILTAFLVFLLASSSLAQEETKKDETPKQPLKENMVEKKAFEEPPYFLDIESSAKANSAGIYDSYSIELMDADIKTVEKAWKDLMKSYKGKTKFNRKEAEFGTLNARISELGSSIYNVRASIESRGDNVIVYSWYESEDGYVNGDMASEDSGVHELLQNFAVSVRQNMVKDELNSEEKVLKQTESQLKKLQRQNEGYHRDIEVAKKKIADAEQKIIENEAEQESTVMKIDGQREIVEAVRQRLKRIKD
ncbi:MAG: hypothetical protein KJP00_01645 [Bacteroidia bacterium]|nr:hypothetical protein [Bacteroidia bacterium]